MPRLASRGTLFRLFALFTCLSLPSLALAADGKEPPKLPKGPSVAPKDLPKAPPKDPPPTSAPTSLPKPKPLKKFKCPVKNPAFCAAWQLCKNGQMPACGDIGIRYERGIGVKRSVTKAIKYYKLACTTTFDGGCMPAVQLLLKTKRNAQADAKAFGLLLRLCSPKKPMACALLGSMYLHGRGTAKDLTKAHKSAALACQQKIPEGCFVVANAKLLLATEAKAKQSAAALLKQQCIQGYIQACMALHLIYKNGLMGKANSAKSEEFLHHACAASHANACFILGGLLASKAKPDLAMIVNLFEQGCRSGHKPSCAKAKVFKAKRDAAVLKAATPKPPVAPPTTRPGERLPPAPRQPTPSQPAPRR